VAEHQDQQVAEDTVTAVLVKTLLVKEINPQAMAALAVLLFTEFLHKF
jgi:hypothetical protein